MSFLSNILSHIEALFTSDKAKKAIQTAAAFAQIAEPIVAEIAALTPNRTLSEIVWAYDKYAVPFTATINGTDPNATGNALLNLATAVLQAKLPADKANVATNILQTAVQLAVTNLKAT